ncbi:MAG: tail fiber domain-containing protein [Bacteroidales bacterium]|nr:tail fiber domain-containing protein [Bacteroidales bacterium]
MPIKAGGLVLGTSALPLGAVYTQSTNTIFQTSTSDRRVKRNITSLNDAMQGILSLNPISFDYDYEKLFMNPELAMDKVGFIAQEVKEIFPKLVHYDSSIDLYTLDYVSLIPYLVKGFQEEHAANELLRQQMEDMQETIDLLWDKLNEKENPTPAPKNSKKSMTANETDNAGTLSQNAPNPFSESTTIAYTLPAKAKASILNIYSSTGNLVYTYVLPTSVQRGTITVEGHTLTPGFYTYSLIVGGRILDSKRMVVTE